MIKGAAGMSSFPFYSFSSSTTRSPVFFLFFLLLTISYRSEAQAGPNYLYHICPNNTVFSPNSTYQRNLNATLSTLASSSTSDYIAGFTNATTGQASPDRAYGLFLCRGDQNLGQCQACVTTASQQILRLCPQQRVAIVWYDECMLTYSNQSIFSTMRAAPAILMYNTVNNSDPNRFNKLISMMSTLLPKAASGQLAGKKFAVDKANFTTSQTLYTLAQCTPDLTVDDCNRCFQALFGELLQEKEGARLLLPSCNIRYEVYPFYNETAVSLLDPTGKRKISAGVVAAIVAPITAAMMAFLILCCFLRQRALPRHQVPQDSSVEIAITTAKSLQFDFPSIQAATDNFSADNKLGEGGFGEVYKGLLNGQEVAVKRLSRSSCQGATEFMNEVIVMAKLQHRNLVQLLGFCLKDEEKILVYEYVPNKSLDYFLFDKRKRGDLDWSTRYKIISGIARGMLYLHEGSQLRIIHRDLKPSNVLLDMEMNPKISDFGMARIFDIDQTQGTTKRVVGTYGYMSPEYAMHGQFSVKSDVYSFGVLILEIISGEKNSSFYQSDHAMDLPSNAWKHWRDGTPMEVLDPILRDSCSRKEVIRCIHMSLLCLQEDPADRPTMATIVLMLSSYSFTSPVPKGPAFFLQSSTNHMNSKTGETGFSKSTSKSKPMSLNEVSVTEVEPR